MKKYLIALVMIVMIMSCFFGKTLVMANVREYVYELKLINGMVSDEIRAGNMISVEYYAETPGNPYIK